MPALNKPIAYMAADVNTLTPVLRKNISDYPRCLELETATNASAEPLVASKPRHPNRNDKH
jgi:hypothetical protein